MDSGLAGSRVLTIFGFFSLNLYRNRIEVNSKEKYKQTHIIYFEYTFGLLHIGKKTQKQLNEIGIFFLFFT